MAEKYTEAFDRLIASGRKDVDVADSLLIAADAEIAAKDQCIMELSKAFEEIMALVPDHTWPEKYCQEVREIAGKFTKEKTNGQS